MSQLQNDVPDFSINNVPSANLLASLLLTGPDVVASPIVYAGASASLAISWLTEATGTGQDILTVSEYATDSLSDPIVTYTFTSDSTGTDQLVVPVFAPYAQIQLTGVNAGAGTQTVSVYQSGLAVVAPQSLTRGTLYTTPGLTVAPGSTSKPFAFISPGEAALSYNVVATAADLFIVDAITDAQLWGVGGITASSGAIGNGELVLTSNLCAVVMVNNGGANATFAVSVVC